MPDQAPEAPALDTGHVVEVAQRIAALVADPRFELGEDDRQAALRIASELLTVQRVALT